MVIQSELVIVLDALYDHRFNSIIAMTETDIPLEVLEACTSKNLSTGLELVDQLPPVEQSSFHLASTRNDFLALHTFISRQNFCILSS